MIGSTAFGFIIAMVTVIVETMDPQVTSRLSSLQLTPEGKEAPEALLTLLLLLLWLSLLTRKYPPKQPATTSFRGQTLFYH